jgi:hypothetical protein
MIIRRAVCVLFCAVSLLAGQACATRPEPRPYEYNERIVAVTGQGAYPADAANAAQARLLAREAAIQDGYRQILEHIEAIRVTSDTCVRNAVAESVEVKTYVEGYIRNAGITAERNLPEKGIYEVDMELRWGAPFMQELERRMR